MHGVAAIPRSSTANIDRFACCLRQVGSKIARYAGDHLYIFAVWHASTAGDVVSILELHNAADYQ